MFGIEEFEKKLENKRGQLIQLEQDFRHAENEEEQTKETIKDIEQSQLILQNVAQKTQKELEYRLSEIVSLALASVFDDPYKLKIDFVIKRGKTECNIMFERNGELFDPMCSSGGGTIDIAAMALRVSIWSLTQPKTRNALILDEPFRFLSIEYQEKASLMLKEISKKLNLQIIMVSHSETLINGADKIFRVSIKKGVSKII